MTTYGYCRVSTKSQKLKRQIDNIKDAYPDAVIFQEKFTGTTVQRPEWNKLYKKVKSGDTIVFDSVSRMSRTAEDGVKEYKDLYSKGVNLIFLKEPMINTSNYKEALKAKIDMTGTSVDVILEAVNQYLMIVAEQQIRIAFDQAEKEVMDLHQRISEGIRKSDKQVGNTKGAKLHIKKKEPVQKRIFELNKDFNGSLNDKETMAIIKQEMGISRNTYYKYKRELKNSL